MGTRQALGQVGFCACVPDLQRWLVRVFVLEGFKNNIFSVSNIFVLGQYKICVKKNSDFKI